MHNLNDLSFDSIGIYHQQKWGWFFGRRFNYESFDIELQFAVKPLAENRILTYSARNLGAERRKNRGNSSLNSETSWLLNACICSVLQQKTIELKTK
jgi:hypothetical protein